VHLTREGAAQASGPTVFQLSRVVRVGREIGFEYRLVMRSGSDLGVVRLPLSFGEKVLDVAGASGWRVEQGELILPTSGRSAEMTVTGSLAKVERFAPDARSGYEWWLLESDPEHRIKVTGDARQMDSAESPIPRTQANARLFLVQKGQHIEVAVTSLTSVEVLAAVVRSHTRSVVLTQHGDLVSDDALGYENTGVDYLLYAPGGRPIYLSTDSKAERIMHQEKESREVMVPLRTGSHHLHIQALAAAALGAFGGRLDLPMPSYPLTASRVNLAIGVPARVVPLVLLGGDRPAWLFGGGDVAAVLIGFAIAWLAVRVAPDAPRARARSLRLLGGAVLCGLWFLSGGAFVAVVTLSVAAGIGWLFSRMVRGARLAVVLVLALGFVGIVGLVMLATVSSSSRSAPPRAWSETAPASAPSTLADRDVTGNVMAQVASGGVVEGVTPVALTMPSYVHGLDASRELVTRDRPFQPTLYYVTDRALWPLGLLWLAGAIVLAAAHRAIVADLVARVRARLAPAPPGPPPGQPPAEG
jgi:hypothetical protein